MRFNDAPVAIVRQLVNNGFEAYIVGGAVRDMLLEKQPKDYDITTNATPEEVRRVFGRRKCRLIGKRFRLALVFWDGETYEVSTFRKEPNHIERRGRPTDKGEMIWNDNVFGTLEDDVRRRDFTANALYYDVNTDEIIDMINGMEDPVGGCFEAKALRGYIVRNGEITDVVKSFTLTGKSLDILKTVDALSNEVILDGGMCGKGIEDWVRVSSGGPHMRARMIVGGGQ